MNEEELLARARARRESLLRQHQEQADAAERGQRAAAADLQTAIWGTAEAKRDILPRMVARVEQERDEQRKPADETGKNDA
jgi:hypothetical protein